MCHVIITNYEPQPHAVHIYNWYISDILADCVEIPLAALLTRALPDQVVVWPGALSYAVDGSRTLNLAVGGPRPRP